MKRTTLLIFLSLLGAQCLFAACVSSPTWAKTLRLLPRSSLGKPHQMWAPFSHWCYPYFGSGSESGSVCFLGLPGSGSEKPWFLPYLFVTSFWLFVFDKLCKCTVPSKIIKLNNFKKKISFLLASWRLMTKIAGGSGSIGQRHGSAGPDPDPHQNVMDPQHWMLWIWVLIGLNENALFQISRNLTFFPRGNFCIFPWTPKKQKWTCSGV